jgi:hypothetical protein
MLHQKGQGRVDGRLLDDMVVVEHEREGLGNADHIIEHGGQNGLDRRRLGCGRTEQQERQVAKTIAKLLYGRDDVAPKPQWIIVGRVQR